MSDKGYGNVTNLCRRRRQISVTNGFVTETGPFIPISLGMSDVDSEGSWEECCDENGVSIGVERKTFRLNVLDGVVDHMNDEDLRELRACGGNDGSNSVREVPDEQNEVQRSPYYPWT